VRTCLRGRYACIRAEQDRLRMVAYEQAQWIAFAFHDPSNPPKFRSLSDTVRADADDRQRMVDNEKVRAWFLARSQLKVV
jgi:hypothetical protein